MILTCLTQLSMHDQSNVKFRLHGAHLVGQILMQNCPSLVQPRGRYSDTPAENV